MTRPLFKSRRLYTPRRGIQPEERLHLDVAAFLHVALRPPTFWSTIGHGSRIGIRERGMLKGKGTKAGLPDIMVFHPPPLGAGFGCIVVCPELKAKRGRASDDQVETHEAMTVAGARIGICKSVEDVIALLERHGIPLHARVMAGGGIMADQMKRAA